MNTGSPAPPRDAANRATGHHRPADDRRPVAAPPAERLARGAGQHVLVVTGDPDIAELLTTTLELAGYRISLTGTGAEAVARVVERRFDLVVFDTDVPDQRDFDRERRPELPYRPPVLLLTECESLGRLVPELGPGRRDYVTKPFRIAEVLARIQVLLRHARPGRPGGNPLHYGDLVLDDTVCRARRGGKDARSDARGVPAAAPSPGQRAPCAVQGADRPPRLGRPPRRQRRRAARLPAAPQGGPGRPGTDPHPPRLRLLAGRNRCRCLRADGDYVIRATSAPCQETDRKASKRPGSRAMWPSAGSSQCAASWTGFPGRSRWGCRRGSSAGGARPLPWG